MNKPIFQQIFQGSRNLWKELFTCQRRFPSCWNRTFLSFMDLGVLDIFCRYTWYSTRNVFDLNITELKAFFPELFIWFHLGLPSGRRVNLLDAAYCESKEGLVIFQSYRTTAFLGEHLNLLIFPQCFFCTRVTFSFFATSILPTCPIRLNISTTVVPLLSYTCMQEISARRLQSCPLQPSLYSNMPGFIFIFQSTSVLLLLNSLSGFF